VRFNDDSNLGLAGGRILLRDGGLELPAGYTVARSIEVLNAAASIKTASGQTHLISSDISGAGRLNLIGGTFTLSGNNSHADGVALNKATLVIDRDERLGAAGGALNIASGTLRASADLAIAAGRSSSFSTMTADSNGFDMTFNQAVNSTGLTKGHLEIPPIIQNAQLKNRLEQKFCAAKRLKCTFFEQFRFYLA
jgi:hypothetical protein